MPASLALSASSISRRTPFGNAARAGVVLKVKRRAAMHLRCQEENRAAIPADLPAKALLWTTWIVYDQQIFFSDQPCGANAAGDLCGIGMPTIM